MRKARGFSMHAARFASLVVIGSWFGGAVGFSQPTAAFNPILELEKAVFVVGESVRLWVGVTADADVPEGLHESGVMHIVCPDGSRIDDPVSWPRDGNSSSWKGGWGFGKHPPGPGRYIATFEFAGQRTSDRPFEIIPNTFSNGIEARWVFFDTESGGSVHMRGVLLHIQNKTGRVLRVAKPGLSGSDVSVKVKAFQPPSSESKFVPQSAMLQADEIPSFSFERLGWDNQSRWPMITVPAGGFADRRLLLQSAYSFRDGQEYEITLGTVLTVFVGEREDFDAQLFPLRIPVSATARLRW
jgi:hypothetical protein